LESEFQATRSSKEAILGGKKLPIKDLQAQASKPINTLTPSPKIRDKMSKRYTGGTAIMETKRCG
jgi:hypothetical protein